MFSSRLNILLLWLEIDYISCVRFDTLLMEIDTFSCVRYDLFMIVCEIYFSLSLLGFARCYVTSSSTWSWEWKLVMDYKYPFSLEQYLNKTADGTLKIWWHNHTICEVWYCCVVKQKCQKPSPRVIILRKCFLDIHFSQITWKVVVNSVEYIVWTSSWVSK